jgi:hypothetical protein
MCLRRGRSYAVSRRAPEAARDFAHALIVATLDPRGWSVADDVSIVVSELVSEALSHDAATLELSATVHFDHVELRCADDRPSGAEVAPQGLRAQILEQFTAHMRAERSESGQAVFVARVACNPTATAGVPCELRDGSSSGLG